MTVAEASVYQYHGRGHLPTDEVAGNVSMMTNAPAADLLLRAGINRVVAFDINANAFVFMDTRYPMGADWTSVVDAIGWSVLVDAVEKAEAAEARHAERQ